jgi:hypothetical protein
MPTSARENRQKETAPRRKPASVLNSAGRDKADGEANAEKKSCGQFAEPIQVKIQENVWHFLKDGTGLCLSTGETMSRQEVIAFKAKASRFRVEGLGLSL